MISTSVLNKKKIHDVGRRVYPCLSWDRMTLDLNFKQNFNDIISRKHYRYMCLHTPEQLWESKLCWPLHIPYNYAQLYSDNTSCFFFFFHLNTNVLK